MDARLEQRWAELAPLLDDLVQLPRDAREACLAEIGADAELCALLRELLEHDDRAGAALEAGCDELRHGDAVEADALPRIAGYQVLKFIGAGGMASVFLAERELAGATQRVALKLLRLNVHDPQERRLFRREQTALSRMEHVNIARLIDSGFAADGTPWLAVEYVDGEALLQWCDARTLPPRARARLFLDICAAVTAAHQALIVHRDLKPANVLVRADGTVKLVDFGIAKLLESDADATRTELRRLTPAYAAPEQFRGEPAGTGADIYALGVMLAELLSGTRPQLRPDGSALRLDTRRVDTAQAQARGLDRAGLFRLLRGDIDAIVARALRPEPRQRYASVEALAADVRAWLEFRPVAARRGNRRYRIARFLRRNRTALAVATTVAAALLAATVLSLHLAHRAELAAVQSRADAQRARHVQDFVLSLFRGDGSNLAEDRSTSPAELVERALQAARQDFRDQPESLVLLLTVLGELERNLGRTARAVEVLEEATALATREFGPTHALTLQAQAELAHARFRGGDYARAAAQLEQALRDYRGGGGGDNEAVVAALVRLGMLEVQLSRESQALARLDEAVQLGRQVHGGDHPALQRATEIYGGTLADGGQLDRAAEVLGENLALARRIYGDAHVVVASALESLAVVEMNRARLDQAAALVAQAAAILRDKAPTVHTLNAYVANTEGTIALRRGDTAAATQAFQRALGTYRALHAGDHPMIAATLGNLARAAEESADAAAAAGHFAEALRISQAVRPATDFRIADFRCGLARAWSAQRLAGARNAFDTALAEFAEGPANASFLHADCVAQAAQARLRDGDAGAALALASAALAGLRDDGDNALAARLRLHRVSAEASLHMDRHEDAAQQLQAALALAPRSQTPRQSAADWNALVSLARLLGDASAAAQAQARGTPPQR